MVMADIIIEKVPYGDMVLDADFKYKNLYHNCKLGLEGKTNNLKHFQKPDVVINKYIYIDIFSR